MGKSSWWQFIRAVCIIAVIMIHCPNAIGLQHNNLQFQLYFFLRSTINFPVAIFLFMAGYFTNIEKCSNNTKSYIINRGGIYLFPIWFGQLCICAFQWLTARKSRCLQHFRGWLGAQQQDTFTIWLFCCS